MTGCLGSEGKQPLMRKETMHKRSWLTNPKILAPR